MLTFGDDPFDPQTQPATRAEDTLRWMRQALDRHATGGLTLLVQHYALYPEHSGPGYRHTYANDAAIRAVLEEAGRAPAPGACWPSAGTTTAASSPPTGGELPHRPGPLRAPFPYYLLHTRTAAGGVAGEAKRASLRGVWGLERHEGVSEVGGQAPPICVRVVAGGEAPPAVAEEAQVGQQLRRTVDLEVGPQQAQVDGQGLHRVRPGVQDAGRLVQGLQDAHRGIDPRRDLLRRGVDGHPRPMAPPADETRRET